MNIVVFFVALIFFIVCMTQNSMTVTLLGLVVMLVALIYIIVSFYMMFSYKEDMEDILKGLKQPFFKNEIHLLRSQLQRLESREDVISAETNSNLEEAYRTVKDRVEANIKTSVSFIQSYDYVAKPEPTYLRVLLKENDELLDKLNQLIELNLKADNTSYLSDTEQIEDLIKSLEEITHDE